MRHLLLIVRRSLRQHAASSCITVLATGLACGLVMAVFALAVQTRHAFTSPALGFDAVVGARGSPVQLVLNTVFHLETSPGNVPWSLYQRLRADPRVALALPYAVGDSFRSFRVVGTTDELFTRFEPRPGEHLSLAVGRPFDPARREVVLGASVARATGLHYGDTLHFSHGVSHDAVAGALGEALEHDDEFVVVGVLAPTGSPDDRVVYTPIEAVFRMDGHVLRGDGEAYEPQPGVPIPERHKQVSAVLLRLAGPGAGFSLREELARPDSGATLAWPLTLTLVELFDKLGWIVKVLELVAGCVMVVAAGTILAGLTNAMNERRREFAILRALGARRRTLFAAIVLEASALAGLGGLFGYLVYAALVGAAAWVLRTRTGIVLDLTIVHPALLLTPPAMVALGALAGWIPARRAYATDVASHLVPPS